MQAELRALKMAGILVFTVGLSNRADPEDVRAVSTVPQLYGFNYFLSPSMTNLDGLAGPLATEVFHMYSELFEHE